jgi:hypothetical protein
MSEYMTHQRVAAWLSTRAESYADDAHKFADAGALGEPVLGTAEDARWALAYETVAGELRKVAADLAGQDAARELGRSHRGLGASPYGDYAGSASGALICALGQQGPRTDCDGAYRRSLIDAYAEGLNAAA